MSAVVRLITAIVLILPISSGYSVNCRSALAKQEIRKCTQAAHGFQSAHERMDGNRWLEANVSKELNAKCEDAMNCLHLLDNCAVFEDDDILWLDDFCDSYDFLTGANFHDCAVKIDKNQRDPCVQHYLVNSPYFMLDSSQRCQMLKSDGACVKSVIGSTCSTNHVDDFQGLLDRQLIRLKC